MTQTSTSETPAPVPPEIKDIIATAAGLTWSHFKARHPAQSEGIERSLGGKPIVPEIIRCLEADERYEDLVDATETEADVAEITATIAPLVIDALFTILAA